MNGKNYWLWTFVEKWVVIYEIDKTCSKDVPKRIIGGFKGNVTSDLYSAWNYVGKAHQRCHIHYIREIEDTIQYKNPGKEFTSFAVRLKRILYASHDAAKITNEVKRLQVKKNLERRISAMIPKKYSKENCIRFVKRLKRERVMLFTFLQTGTDYHNNMAERAIRPNVIIRKITNSHRSKAGADSHKILMSIKET